MLAHFIVPLENYEHHLYKEQQHECKLIVLVNSYLRMDKVCDLQETCHKKECWYHLLFLDFRSKQKHSYKCWWSSCCQIAINERWCWCSEGMMYHFRGTPKHLWLTIWQRKYHLNFYKCFVLAESIYRISNDTLIAKCQWRVDILVKRYVFVSWHQQHLSLLAIWQQELH